ncbi:MAG: polyprenol phosphomannose-dependent alpha 1,6 mannosyltransferase MptB [Mycobacteriaceae bacterium]
MPLIRHHFVPGAAVAHLHDAEAASPPLNNLEIHRLQNIRRFGATGTVLMAIGALGVGAQPVLQNPVAGVRILSLPARMIPTALTMSMTGAAMLVLAWLLLSRYTLGSLHPQPATRKLSRSQLDRTLLLWMLPLMVAPPMFSKDVYSYLAQSEITARGLNPYEVGPRAGLGVDNIFTRTVPTIWRDTPSPYGPFFMSIGRGIRAIADNNIVIGIFLHRVVAFMGVALLIWALPRLAQRCGVAEVTALWLGAANPLLLFHLIAGIHNEAIMLGLMLAGVELCLSALEQIQSATPVRLKNFAGWTPLLLLTTGTTLIVLSAMIKIISILALGFVGMALARKWGANWRAVARAAATLTPIAITAILIVSFASGLGFGWTGTLGAATTVRSWMSLPTLLGLGTGQVGVLLGIGDHTTSVLSLTRSIATIITVCVIISMLFAVRAGRLHPIGGLGVSLGTLVVLFPVVQPWYLLWAITPLAAWATKPVFRGTAIALTILVSIVGPMPNGGEYKPLVIVQAVIATILILAVLVTLTFEKLPWRRS